ncbi:hypothetical protein EW146_g6481 [Bondarzewia mesenterica]|uniref:Uncharacterized protein n=1 Tax=Bondarzewia mesenterica TaxID=1095465 RepID=A0A4S4LQB7_9AGAM|nr:hypothetical protein EW146_g6481 [Bondarzewia mesenterica]
MSRDADIFPYATGEAAKTVEKHSAPQELVFYSGWFCPFVQRTWIALEEKGIPYQYKEVNPYLKEKHFLDINPKGLVPAVEYKNTPLYESLILCEFLEDAFPDYKPQLLPSDPIERARARIWIDHITKNVVPAFHRLIQAQEKPKQEAALEEFKRALRTLVQNVRGPYFFGEEWNLVDTAIAPWATRDYIPKEHRGYRREDVGDGWKEYAEKLESRESVLRTTSDKEHYLTIYGRYLRDEAQSEAAKAIHRLLVHSTPHALQSLVNNAAANFEDLLTMPNSLTRQAGLKLGPLFLETLVKHYFERIKKDASSSAIPLRQDELLYDEVFSIVKNFLEASTKHTVEELQSFSNTRTPSPPWVHIVRLLVPMSCCDEAARLTIKAFGGEETMKRTVGGTKWWQVRGVSGIEAEWITAKKDWQHAKRRAKEHQKGSMKGKGKMDDEKEKASSEDNGEYQPEMDEMRCILYSHGGWYTTTVNAVVQLIDSKIPGGYYFGSIAQERYSMQRYARKIHGRVFAVNYRLAPQYPFPCAIQDLLAAYLYLIRPPEGAAHKPVKPGHIIIAGDSAGGGLSLALLQVIRDAGLPAPGGGVLISPWCDFTHSFPSIFANTESDVIPPTGLSLHKPSALWPPPSDDMTGHVRDRLLTNIRDAIRPHSKRGSSKAEAEHHHAPSNSPTIPPIPSSLSNSRGPVDVGLTASLPSNGSMGDQSISLVTAAGDTVKIDQQIQLYAPNGLLRHPLVSPALSYLGGLPPLFFIASDREVLRDEVIYASVFCLLILAPKAKYFVFFISSAHRAAFPERFPLREEVRKMYPALEGIETRFGPTSVHLQNIADAAHVLPVLFSFSTPAKYCYRAIATFCKHVTNMNPVPLSPITPVLAFTQSPESITPNNGMVVETVNQLSVSSLVTGSIISSETPQTDGSSRKSRLLSKADTLPSSKPRAPPRRSLSPRHSITSGFSRATLTFRSRSLQETRPIDAWPENSAEAGSPSKEGSGDVAGPRFGHSATPRPDQDLAGNPQVYVGTWGISVTNTAMIRERISTQGVIRPLEPESELSALQVPPDLIGTLSERAIQRYLTGKEKFDKKFSRTIKRITKHRERNLKVASKDASIRIARLQHYLNQDSITRSPSGNNTHSIGEALFNSSASWSLAWALDGDERPPPSSIVARRDTQEAIELARVADRSVLADESAINANSLWSIVVNFLTVTPETSERASTSSRPGSAGRKRHRHGSKFVPFWRNEKSEKDGQGVKGEKSDAAQAEAHPRTTPFYCPKGAGVGSQNSTLISTSGNSVSWSTNYTWANSPNNVKSYANVESNTAKGVQLSAITTAPTTWRWTYETQSAGIRADVSYDIWFGTASTGSPASSASSYEIMIWLSGLGGIQPVGSQITTGTQVAGSSWNLWKGPNANWEVFSFVSADGNIQDFNADLNDFFQYLVAEQGVSNSQFVQAIQTGTEPFTGTANLVTSEYSVAINA